MAVPKRRVSQARAARRHAQWIKRLKGSELTTCPHCSEVVMTYRACPECGYYRGRPVGRLAGKEEK